MNPHDQFARALGVVRGPKRRRWDAAAVIAALLAVVLFYGLVQEADERAMDQPAAVAATCGDKQ